MLAVELECYFAGGSVSVLFYHQVNRDRGVVRFSFIHLVGSAVEEHHDIGILLDGSGVAEVREAGFALSFFYISGELGECYDGHTEFAGDLLEGAGYFGDVLYH